MLEIFGSASLAPENITDAITSQGEEYIKSSAPDYSHLQRKEQNRWAKNVQHVEEEDEADPEWVDFDPKKESGTFFGRTIQDEEALRGQVLKEKERIAKAWKDGYRGHNIRKPSGGEEDDVIEKLKRESEAAEQVRRQAKIDVAAKVAELERSDRNYSDIDLIYEKNAKQKKVEVAPVEEVGSDDDLGNMDFFEELIEEVDQQKV
jgi:hypothetical protein